MYRWILGVKENKHENQDPDFSLEHCAVAPVNVIINLFLQQLCCDITVNLKFIPKCKKQNQLLLKKYFVFVQLKDLIPI